MPYPVEHLIEERLSPTVIKRDEPVSKALSLMIEHDFSQLPVVDDENKPIGMVSYESILRGVRNFHSQLSDLHIRDVMFNAPIFNIEDDLFEMLTQLNNSNSASIVASSGELAGIVTSFDATEYFRNRAENLMYVEDIEETIKDFILLAYTQENEILEEDLHAAITKATGRKKNISFENLSLGQYNLLLLLENSWSLFDPIFKISQEHLGKLLNDVRETRNDLAHFRKEISPEQTDQLRFCSSWLTQRWDEFEQLTLEEQNSTGSGMKETTDKSQVKDSFEELELIAEETLPKESRYAPLGNLLASQPGSIDTLQMTFQEIENIIGGDLPPSARVHRAWWANVTKGNPQSMTWLDADWRRSNLNISTENVTFTRIREREKAYIDFFSRVQDALRKKANFNLIEFSHGGQSWMSCYSMSTKGIKFANFSYSFARRKRFRVELYIDTAEQESTKKIFDQIKSNRALLETRLGAIVWERIDDKRASRIALYHPGFIMDDADTLAKLQNWAVDNMIAFYNAIEPIATQAAAEVLGK